VEVVIMPVYKDESKKKNKYWYEFEAGKDPVTGKRTPIRKKGFFTEEDAKKAMVEAMNDFFKGNYITPDKTPFAKFLIETWLPSKKIGEDTRKMYTSHIKNHIAPSIAGRQELCKLEPTHIQQTVVSLREKGLEESSIEKIYDVMNTALNAAANVLKAIKQNPAKFILDKPQAEKKEIVVWDEADANKFVNEMMGVSRYSFVFKLALATGMRQGEILGLRWKDVDFNKNIVRVTQTLSHDGRRLKSRGKTASSKRPIKIDNDTKLMLQKQYNLTRYEMRQAQKEGKEYFDNDLVVCTNNGRQTTPRNIMRVYYYLFTRTKIDVPYITFHNLRHTHATLLLKRGVHPKIVSERLGHKSVKITLDTYSHLLPDMQDFAADSIEDIFGGQNGGQDEEL
jgi:integrase